MYIFPSWLHLYAWGRLVKFCAVYTPFTLHKKKLSNNNKWRSSTHQDLNEYIDPSALGVYNNESN